MDRESKYEALPTHCNRGTQYGHHAVEFTIYIRLFDTLTVIVAPTQTAGWHLSSFSHGIISGPYLLEGILDLSTVFLANLHFRAHLTTCSPPPGRGQSTTVSNLWLATVVGSVPTCQQFIDDIGAIWRRLDGLRLGHYVHFRHILGYTALNIQIRLKINANPHLFLEISRMGVACTGILRAHP